MGYIPSGEENGGGRRREKEQRTKRRTLVGIYTRVRKEAQRELLRPKGRSGGKSTCTLNERLRASLRSATDAVLDNSFASDDLIRKCSYEALFDIKFVAITIFLCCGLFGNASCLPPYSERDQAPVSRISLSAEGLCSVTRKKIRNFIRK
ncbi:hypothetical protein R1flu_017451 [Riccia fluitans]|uniref:Uncharacterized protein n=1 Tax=Riccia fluitans TaxID=41844 RepID=A0ABD1ZDB3_9MARC